MECSKVSVFCLDTEQEMERKHVNEIREILYRVRQGMSDRGIGRELDVSRLTVRKYREKASEHGLLDVNVPLPDNETLSRLLGPVGSVPVARSTVEGYGAVVKGCLERGMEQVAIWQKLRDEYGYRGSYSSVRRYVGRIGPRAEEGVCRVETEPGEEAQVDYGFAGWCWDGDRGLRRQAWMFVMTLSWSRHEYVEFVFDQKMETWLRCHERAFEWFGGVPMRVVIDNVKTAVVKASWTDPVLGEPYRRLAQHYGFVVSANRPRTPEHKGKVESAVHYVKRNFLAGQEFGDLEAMNVRVRAWCKEVAGVRKHGTTGESPLSRYHSVEREALMRLPTNELDMVAAYQAKVGRDCHVIVEGRYYSAPCRWIGEKLDVYVGRKVVEIYKGSELICTHEKLAERGSRSTRVEHYPEYKRAFFENPPERCLERAKGIGEHCGRVVETLLGDRVQDRLRSVHALLGLERQCGGERLEAACERALHYGDGSYRRIQSILRAGLDQEPLEMEIAGGREVRSYRYARPVLAFFEAEVSPC